MERKNQPHILALRARKQRFECARRTQLDVDVFSAREKMQEQLEALVRREIIGTAFARIARSHDERRRQARKFFFESLGDWQKTIETKLEKIRWLFRLNGCVQLRERSDDADQCRLHARWTWHFDRSARYHILNDSGNQRRATVAPFVARSRDDRN